MPIGITQTVTILQVTEEATGEFDPLGTLIVFGLLAAFAYAAKYSWGRATGSGGGLLWKLAAFGTGGIAILLVFALLLNLSAALGVLH